ncbi:uncharacterized protein LOC134290902 [Aedes albopictus]|uniref:Peptidase aspartic putative domain-containing protein n=1 Tax=Aedes albopictus TaxID=7160 RepID=A0ABM1XJ93_AEDAL
MAELKSLVHLRGQVKAKVTRIRKVVDEAYGAGAVQLDLVQLKLYQRNLETQYREYCDLHRQIVTLTPTEKLAEQDETYIFFEAQHNETCLLVETLIQSMTDTPDMRLARRNQQEEPPRIIVQQQPLKAPIPTYDGKPENWPRFKAMFLDVMKTSTDSDAIKLYHLDRALIGGAAGIIDDCTMQSNNYAHAWKLLEERFEDKRLIVDTHITGMLQLKKMTRPSAKELRELIDDVTRHIDGLTLMKEQMLGMSERFVVNLVATALDSRTRMEWEATVPHKQLPTYKDTMDFLKKRCSILERCEEATTKPTPKPYPAKSSSQLKTYAVTEKAEPTCRLCGNGSHPIYKCDALRQMSVPEREAKSTSAVYSAKKVYPMCNSLLMTAMVQVFDADGKLQPCRVFLDSGSQAHIVSRKLVQSLKLPRLATKINIVGANNQKSSSSEVVKLQIKSRYSNHTEQLECLVADQVTGQIPSIPIDIKTWNIPPGFTLADPNFQIPGEIDLLIGIQHFFKLMMPGQIKLSDDLPILQETRLGWVVAGAVNPARSKQNRYTNQVISNKPTPANQIASNFVSVNSAMLSNPPEPPSSLAGECSRTTRTVCSVSTLVCTVVILSLLFILFA